MVGRIEDEPLWCTIRFALFAVLTVLLVPVCMARVLAPFGGTHVQLVLVAVGHVPAKESYLGVRGGLSLRCSRNWAWGEHSFR